MPFKPGQSGNPGGRPKNPDLQELRRAAQRRWARYLGILDGIAHGRIRDDGARLNARIRAAITCLQVAGVPLNPDNVSAPPQTPPAPLSPEELRARMKATG